MAKKVSLKRLLKRNINKFDIWWFLFVWHFTFLQSSLFPFPYLLLFPRGSGPCSKPLGTHKQGGRPWMVSWSAVRCHRRVFPFSPCGLLMSSNTSPRDSGGFQVNGGERRSCSCIGFPRAAMLVNPRRPRPSKGARREAPKLRFSSSNVSGLHHCSFLN